jgi:Family of unknown function (DUF5678)
MRTIAAKVLDPTHLELTEPLSARSGTEVAVTVSDMARGSTGVPLTGGGPTTVPRALRFRQREQEWCRTHGDVLRGYVGQWVVLEGEEIVAHGDDVTRLVEQARGRGIRSPYVFFIEPSEPGVAKIGL